METGRISASFQKMAASSSDQMDTSLGAAWLATRQEQRFRMRSTFYSGSTLRPVVEGRHVRRPSTRPFLILENACSTTLKAMTLD